MQRIKVSKSVLLAIAVAAAVLGWMVSGVSGDAGSVTGPAAAPARETALPRVSVQRSQARSITREIIVSGRTEPNRRVELRAETEGRVVTIGAERGSSVTAGARIVGLDLRDRQARLEEARALIAYAELQFKAAQELKTQQFVSDTQMADLLSRVVGARAALEEIELEVANTSIVAPFDAVLQERSVEIGDYVSSGDAVAQLVDTDPLLAVGEVSEREIQELAVGGTGTARLVSGELIEGRIRYLAPVAAESTRTFRIELAIPNTDGGLRSGLTAELRLGAGQITAHVLSSALLTLDDSGVVGVKSVNERNVVEFHAVEIVGSAADGITVTGLPEDLRLITVGQGFVKPGERVEAVELLPRASLTDASLGAAGIETQVKR